MKMGRLNDQDFEQGAVSVDSSLRRRTRRSLVLWALLLIVGPVLFLFRSYSLVGTYLPSDGLRSASIKDACPQAAPISPSLHANLHKDLEQEYATEAFKLKAYEYLGGAVRIPYVRVR